MISFEFQSGISRGFSKGESKVKGKSFLDTQKYGVQSLERMKTRGGGGSKIKNQYQILLVQW